MCLTAAQNLATSNDDESTTALRHSVEKISSMTIVFTVMVLLAAAGVDLGLTQLMGSVLHDLPNSRMHEREGAFCITVPTLMM